MAKTVFYIVTCVMERTTVRMDQMNWAAVSFLKQNQLFFDYRCDVLVYI